MVRSQFDERCALVLAPAPESQLTHARFYRQGAVVATCSIHTHSSLCVPPTPLCSLVLLFAGTCRLLACIRSGC